MERKKIYISLIIFLLVIGIQSNIYGKYVIENSFEIATISTDETKPVISYYGQRNTNTKFSSYANKTHIVTIRIKVLEKNISINNLMEKTKVLVGGIEEKDKIVEINNVLIYENNIVKIEKMKTQIVRLYLETQNTIFSLFFDNICVRLTSAEEVEKYNEKDI